MSINSKDLATSAACGREVLLYIVIVGLAGPSMIQEYFCITGEIMILIDVRSLLTREGKFS